MMMAATSSYFSERKMTVTEILREKRNIEYNVDLCHLLTRRSYRIMMMIMLMMTSEIQKRKQKL